jgi:hypothetical protein
MRIFFSHPGRYFEAIKIGFCISSNTHLLYIFCGEGNAVYLPIYTFVLCPFLEAAALFKYIRR